MSQLKDSELSFTDLVQFVMGRTGKGYAKSAEIVDKLYEPHTQQLIDEVLSELPEKPKNYPEELPAWDEDFIDGFEYAIDQVTAILEKKKGG